MTICSHRICRLMHIYSDNIQKILCKLSAFMSQHLIKILQKYVVIEFMIIRRIITNFNERYFNLIRQLKMPY